MRQVRRASWAIGFAAALVISGGAAARADIVSDKPASILIYPQVVLDSSNGVDTVIRVSNTNQSTPVQLHCFYVDANSHCQGGSNSGEICTSDPSVCSGGMCMPNWQEVDFLVNLTAGQPIEWKASDGLLGPKVCTYPDNYNHYRAAKTCATSADCDGGTCSPGIPLPTGVCQQNPLRKCGSDADCTAYGNPTDKCSASNGGTRVPGVPEDPFVGELKCITVDAQGNPDSTRNDVKGEALVETSTKRNLDVASYNAVGVLGTGRNDIMGPNELVLGGSVCVGGENDGKACANNSDCNNPETPGGAGTCEVQSEYNGCPNYLILNHFFDIANNPVPGVDDHIHTHLILVPCTEDLLRQVPGSAVVQYLVFNEFEQRFSTSRSVQCYQDIKLCNIDTRDCSRSIFSVNVAGTLTGQTRMNPIGSGLVGAAIEKHYIDNNDMSISADGSYYGDARSGGFNLHMQGGRAATDVITIP